LSDSEHVVTFMVFDYPGSATESAVIRGVLASRGVPFFFFNPVRGRPATISVPFSRLEDAKRAITEARKLGSEIEEKGLSKE
jgi:hypothetical protein